MREQALRRLFKQDLLESISPSLCFNLSRSLATAKCHSIEQNVAAFTFLFSQSQGHGVRAPNKRLSRRLGHVQREHQSRNTDVCPYYTRCDVSDLFIACSVLQFGFQDDSKRDIQDVAQRVWKEVKDAVLPRDENMSATRIRTGATPVNEAKFQGPTHIVQAKQKETLLSRIMNRFHKHVIAEESYPIEALSDGNGCVQFEGHPVYTRLRGWTDQGKEMAGDFKDRMESSDHPMMHKIQARGVADLSFHGRSSCFGAGLP